MFIVLVLDALLKKYGDYMKLSHSEELDVLFRGILLLKDVNDCRAFFDDLCTVRELEDMSQRLNVALLLKKGVSYLEISQKTGASSATISRVARCLNYGTGGYDIAFGRIIDSGSLSNNDE